MKVATVTEIESRFSSFVKASESGPIVVTRKGRPVAVIVGVQDEDEVERIAMAYSPQLQAIVKKSRKQIQAGEVLEHDEFWKEVAASRAKPRGRRKTQPVSRGG